MPYLAVIIVLTLFTAFQVAARPPPGTVFNSIDHEWFGTLKNNMGGSCCGEADCHIMKPGEWQHSDASGGYDVLVNGNWVPVPKEKMSPSTSIFSAPVACWSPDGALYCFVPPVET